MTEYEKMIAGELYNPIGDKEITKISMNAMDLCFKFNNTSPADTETLGKIAKKLMNLGKNVIIRPPFKCDFGRHIYIGDNSYINFDCTILDICTVTIGENVLIGPKVQIYGATHPLDSKLRLEYLESGKPITIEDNVWIGGGAIICPGITVGKNSVVAAGSVVVKDVPQNCLVGGNPARVIREIE